LCLKKALNNKSLKGNKMTVAQKLKAEVKRAEKLSKAFAKAAKAESRP
jgi:hypothetical protein